jgi:uncharacterized protein YbaP (TraB family)
MLISIIVGAILIIPSFSFVILGVSQNLQQENTLNVTVKPFLWRIEGKNPSYLYGSYHADDERILTLPQVVMSAIEDADYIYTEVASSDLTAEKFLSYSNLPDGQTLKEVLPGDVYNQLDSFLKTYNYDITMFEKMKIWMVALFEVSTISSLPYSLQISQRSYLDLYIDKIGVEKNKELGGLETIEEQLTMLDSLSIEEQIEMLQQTLEIYQFMDTRHNPEFYSHYVNDYAIQSYLNGDLELLVMNTSDPLNEKINSLLFIARNHRMTERIVDLMESNPDTQYFFTIGEGHYHGEEGIVALLENEGFTVTRVDFNPCNVCEPPYIQIDGRCYYPYSE